LAERTPAWTALVWTNLIPTGTFPVLVRAKGEFDREGLSIGATQFSKTIALSSSEETMASRLLIIACMFLLSVSVLLAQTPSPEAMTAARSLVTTMKVADQYKAMLPATLLGFRRTLTQERPEIERDYDAMMPTIEDAFTPYYAAIVDDIATVYANNFTVGEMRAIEVFYRQPVGQKLLEKSPAIMQQTNQAGQDASRKAVDDLRTRLTEALRQKGHKL
jgi:hypothetical protein